MKKEDMKYLDTTQIQVLITSWELVLKNLYDRVMKGVLLFVEDGSSRLSEKMEKYYPLQISALYLS